MYKSYGRIENTCEKKLCARRRNSFRSVERFGFGTKHLERFRVCLRFVCDLCVVARLERFGPRRMICMPHNVEEPIGSEAMFRVICTENGVREWMTTKSNMLHRIDGTRSFLFSSTMQLETTDKHARILLLHCGRDSEHKKLSRPLRMCQTD